MSIDDAEKYWTIEAWSEVEQIEDGMRLDFRRMVDHITTNNNITVNTPDGKSIRLYVAEVGAGLMIVRPSSHLHARNHYRLIHEDGHLWRLRMEPYQSEALATRASLPSDNGDGK